MFMESSDKLKTDKIQISLFGADKKRVLCDNVRGVSTPTFFQSNVAYLGYAEMNPMILKNDIQLSDQKCVSICDL